MPVFKVGDIVRYARRPNLHRARLADQEAVVVEIVNDKRFYAKWLSEMHKMSHDSEYFELVNDKSHIPEDWS